MATETFGSDRMWGLKELPLPEPVSYFPQTAGWAVVAVVILALAGWFAWRRWQAWKKDAYRRDGVVQLSRMTDRSGDISGLPFLIRKSALAAFPRADVASLRGADWTAWLNETAGRSVFKPEDSQIFDDLVYQAGDAYNRLDENTRRHLLDASLYWMRKHRAAV